MIGGQQIRMARAGLRWTIEDLAEKSGVGSRTIKRVEAVDYMASVNLKTLLKLKSCLEEAGIDFTGTPDDRPGVVVARQTS
jgi:transcriptional regulator with XRE-family HTH domain